jgi:hypothetical protein
MVGVLVTVIVSLGLTVGMVALVVLLVRRSNQKLDAAWGQAAQQHGLAWLARRHVSGRKYGVQVNVGVVYRGSGDNRRAYTVVSSRLDRPLDLGVSLRRNGFFNDMFHKSLDIVVGDPPFDHTFIVSADEEHRARSLLQPRLRQLLMQHLGGGADFSLGDQGMSVECSGVTSNAHWLSWAIELCARVGSKMDQARRQIPGSSALAQHRQAWAAYATAQGLTGEDTPLCMYGAFEGSYVSVYAVRTGRFTYQLEVALRFAEPLAIGLDVRAKGLLDKVSIFFGGQDHLTGYAPFDDTFRVRAADEIAAPTILDHAVCHKLLQMQAQLGPTTLDDQGLYVRLPFVPQDPSTVPRVVQYMTALADDLGARRGSLVVGPYR